MRKNNLSIYFIGFIAVVFIVVACTKRNYRNHYKDINSLIHKTENLETKPFLKAHMLNGDVVLFQQEWIIDTIKNNVKGTAMKYDYTRELVKNGMLSIPIDSVGLFETNIDLRKIETWRYSVVSSLAILNIGGFALCQVMPKSCYGSCPTFYTKYEEGLRYSDAEGFSNAILPSMEYGDIDALPEIKSDGPIEIVLKNEALETHNIKDIHLYAVAHEPGQNVYHGLNDHFYKSKNEFKPTSVNCGNNDLSNLLEESDFNEYYSLADEENLSSKESIIIDFNNLPKNQKFGLVTNFRQSLMTTYLIYSALGYMGDEFSDFLAQMERKGNTYEEMNLLYKELGNIDVYLWDDFKMDWTYIDGYYETGPIAMNEQLMPLNNVSSESLRIKLELNKGYWRMDQVKLVAIENEAKAMKLSPTQISSDNTQNNRALIALNDPNSYLTTFPGEEYILEFQNPSIDGKSYRYFLYSKGYYLEWMREDWLKEKDLFKLRQMIKNPKAYLRNEAKEYKKYEHLMEESFWNSKISTLNATQHEN